MSKRFASDADVEAVMNIFSTLSINTTISKAELQNRSGLPVRTVRDSVRQIVQQGVPIVADRRAGGYRISTSCNEINAEISRLASHAREIEKRLEALKQTIERMNLSSSS